MKNRLFRPMLCAIFSISLLLFCSDGFAENIDPDGDGSQYAWGGNVGWLNLEPDNDSGVEVGDDALTGYMWSENTGWINMAPVEGGVFNDGDGTLSGYAWGENVGWISFSCENTGNCETAEYGVFIDPANGEFSGYAWGENIGWINFAPNDIPVKTSWSGAVDNDGDGYSSDVDCDDDDPYVNPGVAEVCDGIDNNCNGQIDEDLTDTDSDGQADCVDADDDNDGVADGDDSDSLDSDVCVDSDGDGCDDCAVGTDNFGSLADNTPANDGPDNDGDEQCDASDTDDDNDGLTDAEEVACGSSSLNALSTCEVCDGVDNDLNYGIDEDFTDTDADGTADCVDTDDDNDGVADGDDLAPLVNTQCRDVDADTCDDCSTGTDAPATDGADFDSDELCDAGDPDDDNDGALDAEDSDDNNPNVCSDTDSDACDDCISGTYAPANDGTDTDSDGLCDAGDPDGDGISNAVDTLPNEHSSDFSDETTTGTITAPGDQLLTVTDAADPNKGVRITADPAGGIIPATVRLCGGLSEISLDPGDVTVETCGSIIVEVLNGTVEIIFVADDGTSATTSLNAGNSLECDTATLTVTAPSTNNETAVILVNGEEISLEPGGSKTMMAYFVIDQAKIEVLKGKARAKGTLMLNPNGDDVDISEPITVTVWELSQTVKMVEKGKKGEKWEYKRPKGDTGIIKKMKIDWKKGRFEFSMDQADLSGLTDPNDVNISIQIGDDFGQQTILMREKKHHWDYKYHSSGDMAKFQIEHAKLDFKKKPDDDKVRVQGRLEFDLFNGDGVDISEPVVVTIGPLSQTITMVEKGKKGEKWEYKRPKDGEGNIKHMTIDWKKGRFEIRLDKADLTGVTNPVTISLQIGNDLGEETIQMREKKHHWDYID